MLRDGPFSEFDNAADSADISTLPFLFKHVIQQSSKFRALRESLCHPLCHLDLANPMQPARRGRGP